jgi:putative phosphoserine phosphatase / 1-acylglycerol-3-phosphate O-acyltransferase
MIAAVFDLDRTLLPGTTAERIFLRHLARHRVLGLGAAVETARYVMRTGGSGAVQGIRADRPYLTGVHEASLRLHGRRCALREILPALSGRGIDFLHWHMDRGHHLVLLSGSLPYVVDPLARELGIEDVICSQMKVERQRLSGDLEGLHPYGDAKATLMLEFGQTHDVEFDVSYCYADHHTDESLLQLFGNPVCVNPSEKLRHIAMRYDWRIEEFS